MLRSRSRVLGFTVLFLLSSLPVAADDPDLSEPPDLMLVAEDIRFGGASFWLTDGEPMKIFVPVYNLGGVAATATVDISYYTFPYSFYPLHMASRSITVPSAGVQPGVEHVVFNTTGPYRMSMDDWFRYIIQLVDVTPDDADPGNNLVDVDQNAENTVPATGRTWSGIKTIYR